MKLTTFLVNLLLFLLFYKASCTNERVDFSVDNTTIYTFISTTTTTNYSVQIATTNIKLICYSDTESISWQITLSNGSPHPNSGPTVSINSFNTEKNGVYQCNFGSNINISINLQGTGHGVYYESEGEYGTVSINETRDSQLILQASRAYRVFCSGSAIYWRDMHTNSVPSCPQTGVCQEELSNGERALLISSKDAPKEFECRINFERADRLHKVQFLNISSIIPTNISIQTEPFFPLIDGIIRVRSLRVSIICTYTAYPPPVITLYNDRVAYTDTDRFVTDIDYTEHLTEHDVICIVNNGIARQLTVQVIFDLSITSAPSNIVSTEVTSYSIGLSWGPASSYLERDVIYSITHATSVSVVNTVNISAGQLYSNAVYSYRLDSLSSCTEYSVSIIAYSSVSEGPTGNIAVTTLPPVITVSPARINTLSIGSRHILISWPEAPIAPCPLTEVIYTVEYASTAPVESSTESIVVGRDSRLSDGQIYTLISRLEEYYTYSIRVYAMNSQGDGPSVSTEMRTNAQVPSSTPRYLSLEERTNLTWIPPAVRHQNGIISHYSVRIVSIYKDRAAVEVSVNTSNTYQVIARDQEAVKIEISVTAVNQIGEGPSAVLHVTLNPYRELPDILKQLGDEISTEESKLLLNISLIALQPGTNESNNSSITPTQTSILVASLSRSLQGISQAIRADSMAGVDSSYFQDLLTASSLLWERGILRNEGGSVSPSKNYAEFLDIVNELSRLYAAFQSPTGVTRTRRESTEAPLYSLESKNLHLNVFPISREKFRNEFIELEVDLESGLLSHVTIDTSISLYGGAEGSVSDGSLTDVIHNLLINSDTELEEIRASIYFNSVPVSIKNTVRECVFFNKTLGRWDTKGLTTNHLETGTKCGTNHFTSFGVLVRPFKTEFTREQSLALSVVTYILLSVSLILLSVSIGLYVATSRLTLRVEANIVYFNYAIALFLATGTFLFGIQSATNSYAGCFIVSLLMHYTWLCVFAWSLCIAFLLFYKIWFVFSGRKIWYYMVAFGWVSPMLLVAATAGISNAYYIRTGEDHCWLSRENGVMWSFIGPILVILIINSVLLFISTVRIYRSIVKFDKDKLRALRVSLISAAILIPVLNTPWLLLLFTLDRSTYSIIVEWIFVFLNASNGILFFFLFVLRNNEIMKTMRGVRCVKWFLEHLRKQDSSSSSTRVSSKYVMKKQRTTDSFVEHGLRQCRMRDGMEVRDTTSPRSSIEKPIAEPIYSKVDKKAKTPPEPTYVNLADTTAGTTGDKQETDVGTTGDTQETDVGTTGDKQETDVGTTGDTQETGAGTEVGTEVETTGDTHETTENTT